MRLAAALALCLLATTPVAALTPETLRVDGVARSYLTSNPSGRAGALPLVVALHGGGGTAERLARFAGWEAVARREGILVVYPQGLDNAWNDGRGPEGRIRQGVQPGDDVAFLSALVDELVRRGRADPRRVYLTGVSNGGFMAVEMACRAAGRFAAIGSVIATAPATAPTACRPARPIPIAIMAGTADPLIPYEGGAIRRAGTAMILSAPDTFALFARLNGCGGAPVERRLDDRDTDDGSTITLIGTQGCPAETRLYRVDGGGHQPPGPRGAMAGALERAFGPRNGDIDTATELWGFFRRFTR